MRAFATSFAVTKVARAAGRDDERGVCNPGRAKPTARDATLCALAPGDPLFGEDDSHGERELAIFMR